MEEEIQKINAFLERRMAFLTPCCVLLGVLFPALAGKGVPYVAYVFAFMTFIGGLKSGFCDLAAVLRRPLPLLLCLLSLHVLVPLLSVLTGSLIFPGSPDLRTGITLEFTVPAAVVGLMWTSVYHGNNPLILALVVIDTVLAPFSIPLTLRLLLGESVAVDTGAMMRELLFMIALPAVAAMLLNELTHGYTRKHWPGKLAPFSKLCLIFVVTANSSRIAPYIRHMTAAHLLVTGVILCLAASGYVIGWIAANLTRQPGDVRVAMVFGSGMRNISAGAVIAAAYFPAEVMFPVMIGTLFQQLLAAGFGTLLSRGQESPERME